MSLSSRECRRLRFRTPTENFGLAIICRVPMLYVHPAFGLLVDTWVAGVEVRGVARTDRFAHGQYIPRGLRFAQPRTVTGVPSGTRARNRGMSSSLTMMHPGVLWVYPETFRHSLEKAWTAWTAVAWWK